MDERKEMSDEVRRLTLAYVEGHERGHGPTLEELVRDYPQYAVELIDFAIQHHVVEEAGLDEAVQAEVERDDLVPERRLLAEAFAQAQYPATLTSLIARARQRGYETVDLLAAELDLGTDIVAKLDRRMLTKLPGRLLDRLVQVLAVSLQQLQSFFARPATAAGVLYYSGQAPEGARQQTFAEAIRSSQKMTREQKALWLATVGEELSEGPPAKPSRRPPTRRRGR